MWTRPTIPLHGHQERRFFHGYYDSYCYLPLYVFCGDQLLCARLRSSDQDGAAGSVDEVRRIVEQVRQRWPRTQIVVRADSGFCREELISWCDAGLNCGYCETKRRKDKCAGGSIPRAVVSTSVPPHVRLLAFAQRCRSANPSALDGVPGR
jgi:DDE family transposase